MRKTGQFCKTIGIHENRSDRADFEPEGENIVSPRAQRKRSNGFISVDFSLRVTSLCNQRAPFTSEARLRASVNYTRCVIMSRP